MPDRRRGQGRQHGLATVLSVCARGWSASAVRRQRSGFGATSTRKRCARWAHGATPPGAGRHRWTRQGPSGVPRGPRATDAKAGATSVETVYGITSVAAERASPTAEPRPLPCRERQPLRRWETKCRPNSVARDPARSPLLSGHVATCVMAADNAPFWLRLGLRTPQSDNHLSPRWRLRTESLWLGPCLRPVAGVSSRPLPLRPGPQ